MDVITPVIQEFKVSVDKPKGQFLAKGKKDAPILVIVDPPSADCNNLGKAISNVHLNYFATLANSMQFQGADFAFLTCSPFMPEDVFVSKKKQNEFLKEYRERFFEIMGEYNPKLILTMGNLSAQQVAGKVLKITKARGQITKYDHLTTPVLHTLGVGYVMKSPQNEPAFVTDFTMMKKFQEANYVTGDMQKEKVDYQWCTDLSALRRNPPEFLFVDTETTGLDWTLDSVFPFTVQLCWEPGKAIMIPVMESYYPELERDHTRLMADLKWLLENRNIKKFGHHLKFDYHMCKKIGITIENWWFDTMQGAFALDENQTSYAQSECVRRYISEMAGYSDEFDAKTDKSQMIQVDKDELLLYGCGDADSGLRLVIYLQRELAKDARQWYLFRYVQMPALRVFADTLEENGMYIDERMLQEFGDVLAAGEKELYDRLIAQVPAAVKRKHIEEFVAKKKKPEKALQFSRAAFVIDVLFSKEGFGFKPVVFTKETRRLEPSKRVPSVSAKDHLPYFQEHQFVVELMEYQKLQKMRSTYVGVRADAEGNPTGFWQYIRNGKIFPSYDLHKTATGRTASSNPNGQNLPKRGKYAKAYRKMFVAPPGWTLVQCDYSQAELRFVAWMANEPTMLEAYRQGRDLHAVTAAGMMDISYEQFFQLDEATIEQKRYEAKAPNFGLIYLMSPAGYKEYAWVNYGLTITLKEAETQVSKFFKTYKQLTPWQQAMIIIANNKKFVRGLHGALRRLPNIDSKDNALKNLAERQAVNSTIQRIASDMGVIALTRLHRDMQLAQQEVPIKFCMFIHDALVALIRDDYLEQGMSTIKWYMENNPVKKMFDLDPPIPFTVDVEAGRNLGELAKMKHVVAECPEWYSGDRIYDRAS